MDDTKQLLDSYRKRIRRLEELLREGHGILIDNILDEGYSTWVEEVEIELERRHD